MKVVKNKILKKIIVVLLCFSFLFVLNASASEVSTFSTDDFNVSTFGCFELTNADWVLNGSNDGGSISTYQMSGGLRIVYTPTVDLKVGDVFDIVIDMTVFDPPFYNANNSVTGNFMFGVQKDRAKVVLADSFCYRSQSTALVQYSNLENFQNATHDWLRFNFNSSSIGYSFKDYTFAVTVRVTSDIANYNLIQMYLYTFNMTAKSQEDINTDRIIANQNDNTDKILNSGEYSDIDQFAFGEHTQANQELENNLSPGYSKVETFLGSGFSGFLNGGIGNGLRAVRVMFEEFTINGSGFIGKIIQFALMIGAFGFVIGTAVYVVSRRK